MSAVFDLAEKKGGVIHFLEIAENLSSLGNKVTVVLPKYQKNENYDNIFSKNISQKIFSLTSRSKAIGYIEFELRFFLWNLIYLKKKNFDIYYQRTTLLNLLSGLISVLRGIPYVLEVNGLIREEIRHQGIGSLVVYVVDLFHTLNLKISNHVFTVTKGIKDILANRYGLNIQKISVIENGANHLKFRIVDYSSNTANMLGLNKDSLVIGYVGVFANWHGIYELQQAIISTRNKSIRFILIGDGPLFCDFKAWLTVSKVDNVILTGYIDNNIIHQYISIFDYCYVGITKNPIHGGVSPLKFYEYIACGKNLICSDVPDINEIVVCNKLGYLFKNAQDLTKIFDILEKPLYSDLASPELTRNFFETKYSWLIAAKKTNEILDKIIRKNSDTI